MSTSIKITMPITYVLDGQEVKSDATTLTTFYWYRHAIPAQLVDYTIWISGNSSYTGARLNTDLWFAEMHKDWPCADGIYDPEVKYRDTNVNLEALRSGVISRAKPGTEELQTFIEFCEEVRLHGTKV